MASSSSSVAFFNPFVLSGKVALVTGASSGIGRAFALRLAKQGADVIVAARRKEKLEELRDEIVALPKDHVVPPGRAQVVEMDVSDEDAKLEVAISAAWDAFQGIDILVNNTGVLEPYKPLSIDSSRQDWERTLNVNIMGVSTVLKLVARKMIDSNRRGSVIMVSSAAGTKRGVLPGIAMYSASKAAIIHLGKAMAVELGKHGIRVNTLAPSVFPSEMSDWLEGPFIKTAPVVIPLGRPGVTDTDLTGPLLFLASDASAYVSGVDLIVDAGYTAQLSPLVNSKGEPVE